MAKAGFLMTWGRANNRGDITTKKKRMWLISYLLLQIHLMNVHQLELIQLEYVLRNVVVIVTVLWASSVVQMVVGILVNKDIHQVCVHIRHRKHWVYKIHVETVMV